MLIPLALPPGIVKNGTPYQRRGRWVNSNLVRWYEGSIRQIGGWQRRKNTSSADIAALVADATIEAVRDGFAWRSLNQDQNLVFGSNRKLYHVSQIGTVTDITPGGVTTSGKDASLQAGYGQNPYGVGAYGVSNNLAGQEAIPPYRWAFDNFGELLLTCQRAVGPLYELNPTTLVISTVTNAPAACQDVIVTDQRIVFTLGAGGAPRLAKWSDQEDRNLWTAAVANQAGELTLQGSGKLLRCINVLKQVLILGETDAFTARYVGPPYIYSFDLAGRNCGPVSAEAVVATDKFAVWWGDRQFWLFDGSLQQLPCEVSEFIYGELNTNQVSKITAFTNQKFSEVWWLYQSNSTTTTEVDSYVCWNYRDNTWWTGKIDRTTGVDVGTLSVPVWADSAGRLYNQEQQGVAVDGVAFIESGPIDVANGERNAALRYIYPDTEALGDVSLTVKGKQFPSGAVNTFGPYTYTNPTPTRAIGRELAFSFGLLSAASEVGVMRLELAPFGNGQR